ncbi:MAG: hypothetical protein AABW99_02225 [archaeon]
MKIKKEETSENKSTKYEFSQKKPVRAEDNIITWKKIRMKKTVLEKNL